tara:strand:+ start:99 stop:653 length:555 start_codon:yes stop_codon:yes gene_type:complete
MKKLILISALLFIPLQGISAITPSYIDHDEFKKYSWLSFDSIYAEKYFQKANVSIWFGISHSWREEGINDDQIHLNLQGNVAFSEPNESDIYFLDNHGNRSNYSNAMNSKYQRGETPYGYRMGVGCPGKSSKSTNCLDYFSMMKGKKVIWRFYNGGRKIADLEIPEDYVNEVIKYYEEYKTNYR